MKPPPGVRRAWGEEEERKGKKYMGESEIKIRRKEEIVG